MWYLITSHPPLRFPCAIGLVPSVSRRIIMYHRWRLLTTIHGTWTSCPQGNSNIGSSLFGQPHGSTYYNRLLFVWRRQPSRQQSSSSSALPNCGSGRFPILMEDLWEGFHHTSPSSLYNLMNVPCRDRRHFLSYWKDRWRLEMNSILRF